MNDGRGARPQVQVGQRQPARFDPSERLSGDGVAADVDIVALSQKRIGARRQR
jgi:hypothetical protein